ncbi:hypothetical protein WJX73_008350 [Symbiochloris irregularis]|uniref:Protein kinase domain-containing protein n=1 Tax=Symbiochloris irregularis TaxID=706552 RepID=A0AAW1PHZ8_9CHLO
MFEDEVRDHVNDVISEPPCSSEDPLKSTHTWVKLRELSEGYSGRVVLAQHIKSHQKKAIKLLKRGASTTKRADKEVQTMMLLSVHPHIIRFEEVFLTPQYLGIVLEYAAGGDLSDYIKRKTVNKNSSMSRALPESLTRVLFHQIMSALEFCHDRGITNRDIKAENILVMDEKESESQGIPVVLKMCDFGFSKDQRFDSACKTMCGTAEYIAPEVMEQKPYDGKQADIWSAGVLLFVMLTGRYPFSRATDARLNTGLALQRTHWTGSPRKASLSTRGSA